MSTGRGATSIEFHYHKREGKHDMPRFNPSAWGKPHKNKITGAILKPYNAFLRFSVGKGIPYWIWWPLFVLMGGLIAIEIGKYHYREKFER